MKNLFTIIGIISMLSLIGCAAVGSDAGTGVLYTKVTSNKAVSSNNVGRKMGESSALNVLGLVAVGNAGSNEAARKAGITRISHVDQEKMSILGIVSFYKTIVYGE